MDQETFNLSVRKFLKAFGVHSQREIEQAVANALSNGTITGTESLPARITLEIAGVKLNAEFQGQIALQ
jgi:hypothetical protein